MFSPSAIVVIARVMQFMSDHLFEVDGAHVSRLEDLRLITGAGTYASDWNLPGQLHAAFLRTDRAHASRADKRPARDARAKKRRQQQRQQQKQ